MTTGVYTRTKEHRKVASLAAKKSVSNRTPEHWAKLAAAKYAIRNGKEYSCKKCGKSTYRSQSRISSFRTRYCSYECSRSDIPNQHQEKQKKCTICKNDFLFRWPANKKTCSYECQKILAATISAESIQRRKIRSVETQCKQCHQTFLAHRLYFLKFCSPKCYGSYQSKNRKGKKNPAYRNGFSVARSSIYTGRHLRACAKYRKAFIEKHGYQFCEICGVNQNGTSRFEVHHIYFASLFPKHPNLHDFRNLINICVRCHNDLHSSKLQDVFKRLEGERGLPDLFKECKSARLPTRKFGYPQGVDKPYPHEIPEPGINYPWLTETEV